MNERFLIYVVVFIIPLLTYGNSITGRPEPDWEVNPPDFQYNCPINCIVYVDGDIVTHIDGIIVCFVGDEYREGWQARNMILKVSKIIQKSLVI